MENIVTAIFNVESEAYQAFTQIRQKPFGENYVVAEASLIKCENDAITVVETIDAAAITADDTAAGMLVGSIVGILGGPLGVLLGATVGAATGSTFDAADTLDSLSLLEVTAAKLYEGDVAIVALVQEDEPAFDAAFAGFDTTIIRHFAVDVMDEVDYAREVELECANLAKQQMRAERKAEREEKRAERKADFKEYFSTLKDQYDDNKAERKAERDEKKAKFEEKKAELDEKREAKKAEFEADKAEVEAAIKDAEAEFVAETKEYMGE